MVTEETLTDDHKSDTSFSEIAPTEAGASAASIIQDVKYFTKHPLEHEEPNSVLDHDKETCTDTNDKLNLDKCDKLDPDSIELSREKEAKKNEKTNNTESDLCEIPSDEPAQAQADVRTRATDTEQVRQKKKLSIT